MKPKQKKLIALGIVALLVSITSFSRHFNVQSATHRYFIYMADIPIDPADKSDKLEKKICLYKGPLSADSFQDLKNSVPTHTHFVPMEILKFSEITATITFIKYIYAYGMMDVEEMQKALRYLAYDAESPKFTKTNGMSLTLKRDQYEALENLFVKYEGEKNLGTCPPMYPWK